jgi:hypothetical protein
MDKSVLVYRIKKRADRLNQNAGPAIFEPLHTTRVGDSMQSKTSKRMIVPTWIWWVGLLAVTLVGFAAVLVPALVIQPFKLQTPERLSISYSLRHWSPIITVLALLIAVLIVASLWRRTRRWWRKSLLISFIIPLLVATWFARQNHFEWMFQPLPNAAFAKMQEASFVSEGDMVLSVELNGDAAAYPVRQIAYHHLVQDTIGGVPVLVTY